MTQLNTKVSKDQIIWWSDEQKGLVINAITFKSRASKKFVTRRIIKFALPGIIFAIAATPMLFMTDAFNNISPTWVPILYFWALRILIASSLLVSIVTATLILRDWRKDKINAIEYLAKAEALGVDVGSLDDEWVFERLVLPMIRRHGVGLPDGSVTHMIEG